MDYRVDEKVLNTLKSIINSDITLKNSFSGSFFSFLENCHIFPGFVDVHVHLREPGFSYKETVKTGTMSASRGGFTTVLCMPNLSPVPDSFDNLKLLLDNIKENAVIDVIPHASITKGQKGDDLSEMDDMCEFVGGFSDDGRGVQNIGVMEKAMLRAKELGKIIVAHCEDNSLLCGGYIHDGIYAKNHSHKGICSESEYGPIARDIELLRKTGASYHVCHISTKESVDLIRKAKADGLDITCETAPHYLVFSDADLEEDGRFKMNPPIRDESDRLALIEGIKDGTIDMIATDHAPHSAEEKSKGLRESLMGVVGLETSFPAIYTHLVKTGIITLDRLVELMSTNPAKRFDVKNSPSDFSVWDLNCEYTVNPDEFLSKGKSSPFTNRKLFGRCVMTVKNSKIVYIDKSYLQR